MRLLTSNKYNHEVITSNSNMYTKLLNKMDEFNNSELCAKIVVAMDKFHNNMCRRIKYVKKSIFPQGIMMKRFHQITKYYEDKNFSMIEASKYELQRTIPQTWQSNYYKYVELIRYCQFLQKFDSLDISECYKLKNDICTDLNISHELGYTINHKINQIFNDRRNRLKLSMHKFQFNQIII